jgi:BRCT domain type II-containing protein
MDDDSETPKAKRARLHDSASSSNSEESDTAHYEDDNISDDISQVKVYNINEPSEESHNGFSESLIARDATSEIGSSFRYGSSSWEGSFSENGLADGSDILEPDELSSSGESISSGC